MISLISNKIQDYRVIYALKRLKKESIDVNKSSAISFATSVCDIIKKSTGVDSEHYRVIQNYFYDKTYTDIQFIKYPTDFVIIERLKDNERFDSIIDSVINSIKLFGTKKEQKPIPNFLGRFTDNELITGIIAILFFVVWFSAKNPSIVKFLPPYDSEHLNQKETKRNEKGELEKTDSMKTHQPVLNK